MISALAEISLCRPEPTCFPTSISFFRLSLGLKQDKLSLGLTVPVRVSQDPCHLRLLGTRLSDRRPTPRRPPACRIGLAAPHQPPQLRSNPPSTVHPDTAEWSGVSFPDCFGAAALSPAACGAVQPPPGSSCSLRLYRGCAHRRHGRPPQAAQRLTTGKVASRGDARAAGSPGRGVACG